MNIHVQVFVWLDIFETFFVFVLGPHPALLRGLLLALLRNYSWQAQMTIWDARCWTWVHPGLAACKANTPLLSITPAPHFLLCVWFWGHTPWCLGIIPGSALRNLSCQARDHVGCQGSNLGLSWISSMQGKCLLLCYTLAPFFATFELFLWSWVFGSYHRLVFSLLRYCQTFYPRGTSLSIFKTQVFECSVFPHHPLLLFSNMSHLSYFGLDLQFSDD